ncbi:ANTAR domain-containing response regulator [Kiloniella sp. EL199]|uniref:ANTAR domain-containing response regulator n=1 Tax=Kiloniella sp. EL199 TaxID=2107581 RepID=UPI000EA366CF|nr:ANTAR domain-containing protein [Kiloniella sp. EL199]
MSAFRTPNFRGYKATILHRHDDNIRRLERHLDRLGVESTVIWPDFKIDDTPPDVIFFDGDNGYDGLFPWAKGCPPVPLIALISSEAPGRLEWMLSQETSAHLIKPIQSSGVFSTLVIACANYEKRQEQLIRIDTLEKRISSRPVVFRALLLIMECGHLQDEAAFAILRSAAMNNRQSIEDFASTLSHSQAVSLINDFSADKGMA